MRNRNLLKFLPGLLICLIVLTSCVPKQKNMPYALTQRSIPQILPLPSEAKQIPITRLKPIAAAGPCSRRQNIDKYKFAPKGVALQLTAGIQYRFVFGFAGDDVLAFFLIKVGCTFDRQVVRFGCTRGKDDFTRISADQIGNLITGDIYRFFNLCTGRTARRYPAGSASPL